MIPVQTKTIVENQAESSPAKKKFKKLIPLRFTNPSIQIITLVTKKKQKKRQLKEEGDLEGEVFSPNSSAF